jgi:hypothetical protein
MREENKRNENLLSFGFSNGLWGSGCAFGCEMRTQKEENIVHVNPTVY